MLKVVVDTNVFLDVIFNRDKLLAPIFDKECAREIQFVTCDKTVKELMRKVEDLCTELKFTKREIFTVESKIAPILGRSYSVNVGNFIPRYCEHDNDDVFIECAKVADAHYVISSDAHISDLPACRKDLHRVNVELIDPLDFLSNYKKIIDTYKATETLTLYAGKQFNNGIKVVKGK